MGVITLGDLHVGVITLGTYMWGGNIGGRGGDLHVGGNIGGPTCGG